MEQPRTIDLQAIARKYNLSNPNQTTTRRDYEPPSESRAAPAAEPKSVAFAMRALQDRIKALQDENAFLKSPNMTTESHSHSAQQHKIEALQEQLKFFQAQIEFAEAENKRNGQQFEIDKQNWALELEHLRAMLQKREHQGEALKVQNELFIEKKKNEEMHIKMEDLAAKYESRVEGLEQELRSVHKQLQDTKRSSQDRIQALELQNSNYKQLCETQKQRIDSLAPKTAPRKSLKNTKKPTQRKRSLSVSRSTSSLAKHQTSVSKPIPKKVRIPSPAPIARSKKPSLEQQIAKTEGELGRLNKEYKDLLVSTSDELSDFTLLRKKLDEIALSMEKKSEVLYELKTQQQTFLKKKLGNQQNLLDF